MRDVKKILGEIFGLEENIHAMLENICYEDVSDKDSIQLESIYKRMNELHNEVEAFYRSR